MGGDIPWQLAGQFGPMGLLVAYLVWKDLRGERIAEKRIEADKEIASALALLHAAITGRSHV